MGVLQKTDKNSELKYRGALSLYVSSALSIKEICAQTDVNFSAFSTYLSRYHRDLILSRHNLTGEEKVYLRGTKGQSTVSSRKYGAAISACASREYLEYNLSQIARIFQVSPSSLANQLRRHYPDIVPNREKERRQMGIIKNLQYGVRSYSKEAYLRPIELLRNTDMTVAEVARLCEVSYSGLRDHIIVYHPRITSKREKKRQQALKCRVRGERNGKWRVHEPSPQTVEKYKEALVAYTETSRTMIDIVSEFGLSLGGFQYYLRSWHPDLIAARRGFAGGVDLKKTKRYSKSVAEKYRKAIEYMKDSDLSTSKVAAMFDLNPDTFRIYLKEHYPELTSARGMKKLPNGRTVSSRGTEKYAEAIQLYETSPESLKSISMRLGLVYKSVESFVRRNCPESVRKHRALVGANNS